MKLKQFFYNLYKPIDRWIYKRRFNRRFKQSNKDIDSWKAAVSESGKYRIEIYEYSTGKGTWSYSEATLYSTTTNKIIQTVRRNYPAFPYIFIENHLDGHDYLVCGESYQGATVVQLDTGEKISGSSGGWCWADYTASPIKTRLTVEGCYWGGPYHVRIFDFSDPMTLPFDVEYDTDALEFDTFKWIDDHTIEYEIEREWIESLNKYEDDLTIEEDKEFYSRENWEQQLTDRKEVKTITICCDMCNDTDVKLKRLYDNKTRISLTVCQGCCDYADWVGRKN